MLLLRQVGRWAEGVHEKRVEGDEGGHGHAENRMDDDECCDVGTGTVKRCWHGYSACVSWSLTES